MPKITTQWQRFEELSPDALYEILRFRQSIFVVEQRSPYPDLDGLDQEAWHLAVAGGGRACRLSAPDAGCRGQDRQGRGRRPLRGHGLGRRLMEEALQLCREHYPAQDIVLAAQLYLVPFYESFGFAVISEPYDDFGVPHVEMSLRATS